MRPTLRRLADVHAPSTMFLTCGAMRALVTGPPAGAPALTSGLRQAAPSLERFRTQPPPTVDGHVPAAAMAVAQGRLRLIGMYFDVAAARVYPHDPATGDFGPASVHSGKSVEQGCHLRGHRTVSEVRSV